MGPDSPIIPEQAGTSDNFAFPLASIAHIKLVRPLLVLPFFSPANVLNTLESRVAKLNL